jgi:hypothetical protein
MFFEYYTIPFWSTIFIIFRMLFLSEMKGLSQILVVSLVIIQCAIFFQVLEFIFKINTVQGCWKLPLKLDLLRALPKVDKKAIFLLI